jgi:hypothetical protein
MSELCLNHSKLLEHFRKVRCTAMPLFLGLLLRRIRFSNPALAIKCHESLSWIAPLSLVLRLLDMNDTKYVFLSHVYSIQVLAYSEAPRGLLLMSSFKPTSHPGTWVTFSHPKTQLPARGSTRNPLPRWM